MENTNTNRDQHGNVIRKEGFTQVCVWLGTVVTPAVEPEKFEADMLAEYGMRVQYLEEIATKPNTDANGLDIAGTGGRNDLFFAMATDDTAKFAVVRLQMGIRWLEDVLSPINYTSAIYPERVRQYQTWPQDGTVVIPSEVAVKPRLQAFLDEQDSAPITPQAAAKRELERDPAYQATLMASLMATMLKPQLEAMVDEILERKLQGLCMPDREDFDSAVVAAIDNRTQDVCSILKDEIIGSFDIDAIADSREFANAVEEVVSNMDFQISVEGRGRRY